MLQYLYTYEIFNHGLATATSLQLLIVGDKYELEELREVGAQNLSNEISNLTPSNGQWAAEWYLQICQLEQKGTRALQLKLENVIAKYAGEMIKHDAIRDLIASDGSLAVVLVEKLASLQLASTASAKFGTLSKGTGTDWFSGQAAQGLGSVAASTTATFGSSFSSPSTTS